MKYVCLCIISIFYFVLFGCGNNIEIATTNDIKEQKIHIKNNSNFKQEWPAKNWWTKYNNNDLNRLVEYSIVKSPTIEIAKSRLISALASIKQVNPSSNLDINAITKFDGSYLSKNGATPAPLSGKWARAFTAGLSATYQLDFWGKNRSLLQSATFAAEAEANNIENAKLLISSAVVQNYFLLQLNYYKLTLVKKKLALEQAILSNSNQVLSSGIITMDSLIQVKSTINNIKTQASSIESSISLQKNILISLVGGQEEFINSLKEVDNIPDIQISVPDKLDYNLLSRRADLQAQKLLVESTIGGVKASKAAFYPSFSITAFLGLSSMSLDNLLNFSSSKQYSITPSFLLPIFNTGILKAQLLVSEAKENQAVVNYNQAILNAVQDVNTAVININSIDDQIEFITDNLNLLQQSLNNSKSKFNQGILDKNSLILSKVNLITQQNSLVTIKFQKIINDVNLIKALGGGYKYNKEEASNNG